MKGKLIVIEGLDGCGKATQTGKLYEYLSEKSKAVVKITFPDYESPSSGAVRQYLNGEFGNDPENVNPYMASTFFAVDRAASYLKNWKNEYLSKKLILCDRYTTSNIIYQMSKLPKSEWSDFIDWTNDFEYTRLGLPRPDMVIFLYLPPEESQKLLSTRYNGDDTKKDIHESNLKFLNECAKAALFAAEKCGWRIIECAESGKLKSIEQIHGEIKEIYAEFQKCNS